MLWKIPTLSAFRPASQGIRTKRWLLLKSAPATIKLSVSSYVSLNRHPIETVMRTKRRYSLMSLVSACVRRRNEENDCDNTSWISFARFEQLCRLTLTHVVRYLWSPAPHNMENRPPDVVETLTISFSSPSVTVLLFLPLALASSILLLGCLLSHLCILI